MKENKHGARFQKTLLVLGLGLATNFLALSASHAVESSAPAMFGVQEVVLQFPRLGTNPAVQICGLKSKDLTKNLIHILKGYSVPAFMVTEAKPAIIGRARIELLPEIATVNSQGTECTSWVSLTAQTQSTIVIPPIETARSVSVIYWRSGMLVNSGATSHNEIIADTLDKLSRQFAQQYGIDQPPSLMPRSTEEK